jgi:transposase
VELEKIKAASCCCLMDLTSAARRTRVIRAKEAAMHRDPKQWAYIRRLILEEGNSRKGVSRMTGLNRSTIRRMLKSPQPPQPRVPDSADQKLLKTAQILAGERNSIDPSVYHRRLLRLWGRARDLVLTLNRCEAAALLDQVAELINGNSAATPPSVSASTHSPRPGSIRAKGIADRDWMDRLLRGAIKNAEIEPLVDIKGIALLLGQIKSGPLYQQKRSVVVLAHKRGVGIRTIADHLSISRVSARKYIRAFSEGGAEALFARKKWVSGRLAENEEIRKAVFALLHEPPSASGINRTTWRMADLTRVLSERGTPVCAQIVREITRSAGWKWRKARKVLTSCDPEYRQKVHHIQCILRELQEDEVFFSIDEFGPFSVRAQGGRKLVEPGELPTVPQYQKSKGSLIMTAALELSRNQITHFYSPRKDTGEMIRMLAVLIDQYKNKSRIYLSWDAASWHISKALHDHVAQHNERVTKGEDQGPTVGLAPLPTGAQFLNVIESVFSGMARAILANSNYQSIDEARAAIDRYIRERNETFAISPKRAGGAIWGSEREPSKFSESNNCKDPLYR